VTNWHPFQKRFPRRQARARQGSGSPLAGFWRSISAAVAVVYPPSCPSCQRSLANAAGVPGLCGRCTRQLTDVRPACARCARPLPDGIQPSDTGRCLGCRDKRLAFGRTISIGVYRDELRKIVLRIKKPGNEALTMGVGRLLADQCRSTNSVSDIDLLVPAPLHWTRRLVRGGGCPELLVESMSKALRIPAANGFLRCCRKTKKQGTLLPTERRRNVRHAYRASKAYNVTGAHVLMVDDVMTTGATANEMARVLRKSGATTITLAVVARGIGFDGQ
jgi:ComF family protein